MHARDSTDGTKARASPGGAGKIEVQEIDPTPARSSRDRRESEREREDRLVPLVQPSRVPRDQSCATRGICLEKNGLRSIPYSFLKEDTKNHRMPLSLSAFWRIVSLTAAKTSLMFDVSVAWVRCG